MKTYRDFIQDLLSEEPERTAAYKAMQKTLYPRGSTVDSKTGKDNATMTNVGGWKNRKRDRKSKRNRGYGAAKKSLMSMKEDAPTMSVGTGGFTAAADAKGPVAGYDPLLKMMNRWKKAKTYPNKMADVVNRGKNGR